MTHIVITYIDARGAVVSSVVTGLSHLRSEDEGITWMRGYYSQDSKEVACMKVAHALKSAELVEGLVEGAMRYDSYGKQHYAFLGGVWIPI